MRAHEPRSEEGRTGDGTPEQNSAVAAGDELRVCLFFFNLTGELSRLLRLSGSDYVMFH